MPDDTIEDLARLTKRGVLVQRQIEAKPSPQQTQAVTITSHFKYTIFFIIFFNYHDIFFNIIYGLTFHVSDYS